MNFYDVLGGMKEDKQKIHFFNGPPITSRDETAVRVARGIEQYRRKQASQHFQFLNDQTSSDQFLPGEKNRSRTPFDKDREFWSPSSSYQHHTPILNDHNRYQKEEEEQKIHFFNPPSYPLTSQPALSHHKFDQTVSEGKHRLILPSHRDHPSNSSSWEPEPSQAEIEEHEKNRAKRLLEMFYAPQKTRGSSHRLQTSDRILLREDNSLILPYHKDHPSNWEPAFPRVDHMHRNVSGTTVLNAKPGHEDDSQHRPETSSSVNHSEKQSVDPDDQWFFSTEDTASKNGHETESSHNAQLSQTASGTAEIKEEVFDPEYEASMNALDIDYEEIHPIFDMNRPIDPPSSREPPKMRELIAAFISGDAARIEQLKVEALAELKEIKGLGSSATTEIEKADELLGDSDDEIDDEETNDEENASWKRFVLNPYNPTEEEEEAKFQRLLEESTSSDTQSEAANHVAPIEENTGRSHLRRAAKVGI
ncbi:unnamed protein product [Caenorhabditis brenneri]